jgi:FkbM family methyltransferase
MPVTGIKRYINLAENIENPGEYLFHKGKRKMRSLHFTTRPHAINFEVPESLYQVFKEIFMEDVYNIRELVKKLPVNPVVIDIGANAGFFNVLLLSKIKKARILAYEPLASNTNYIGQLIAANPFMSDSLTIEKAAVTGTEKESIDLFMEDTTDNQVVASVFAGFNKDNLKKTTVPCVSLSKIVADNKLEKIDLLKMDCEGSEYDIIYNTPKEIVQLATHLAIEVHNVDEERNNFTQLATYLEFLGYSITYAPINNFCYAVEAVKR